jgi:hypothetical protein
VTRPPPSSTTRWLLFTTFAVAVMVILTGFGPQLKVMTLRRQDEAERECRHITDRVAVRAALRVEPEIGMNVRSPQAVGYSGAHVRASNMRILGGRDDQSRPTRSAVTGDS